MNIYLINLYVQRRVYIRATTERLIVEGLQIHLWARLPIQVAQVAEQAAEQARLMLLAQQAAEQCVR